LAKSVYSSVVGSSIANMIELNIIMKIVMISNIVLVTILFANNDILF